MLQKLTPYIFAFTLFLSAMLVFSVQPMLGKMMLPHVGGAPAGWAVTMFFFQTCLLFGYGLAHLFSKLPPFLNALSILLMFIPGVLFLPISYHSDLTDTISPLAVFIQLTISTAVPFMALSTIAPGLQRLFSFTNHQTAGDPYYLYAASNIGSFVGLLAYPFILEPLIGLKAQSNVWMTLYGLLSLCVVLSALAVFKNRRDLVSLKFIKEKAQTHLETEKDNAPITWQRMGKWLVLAAIPSSLMIGVTTEITTDIASAPMIWVVPLGLYLLTNIVAFSKRHIINTNLLSTIHLIGVAIISINILLSTGTTSSSIVAFGLALLYLAVFVITASLLHCQLANDRPATNDLTKFYLIVALGGALGGSFNAFVAPNIFNDVYEFYAVLVLSLFLNPVFSKEPPETLKNILKYTLISTLIIAAIIAFTPPVEAVFVTLLIFLVFFATIHAKTLLYLCVIVFTLAYTPLSKTDFIDTHRNFFGVTKVFEGNVHGNPEAPARKFLHGKTLHGFQALKEEYALEPSAYYAVSGPINDIYSLVNPDKVAILGLGVGQMSCYTKPGRTNTYYEIDPYVVEIAKKYFTYLSGCGENEVFIGDARLEIAKDKNIYDLVVVDTFSSDSIPVHLLTLEALQTYFSKLKSDGVVAINISNNHIDLTEILAALAKNQNYLYQHKHFRIQQETKKNPYDNSSSWVALTKNVSLSKKLTERGWRTIESNRKPWTDDYSNLLAMLKIFNPKHLKHMILELKE